MTDTDARLIERLRERHTIVPDIPNDPLAMHINPDGPEAADRIESLTAEVARLHEALEDIADWSDLAIRHPPCARDMRTTARAALGDSK